MSMDKEAAPSDGAPPEFDADARRQKAEAAAKAAPMASAPMRYTDDGSVDWGNMWESFCALAQEGGPRHRPTMLHADESSDLASPAYQAVLGELARGIYQVSGLRATPGQPGWLTIECPLDGMAEWVANAALEENVECRAAGNTLLVPAGANFAVKGEIKNVITVIAKTTHYWADHIPPEMKATLALEDGLGKLGNTLKRLFRRK